MFDCGQLLVTGKDIISDSIKFNAIYIAEGLLQHPRPPAEISGGKDWLGQDGGVRVHDPVPVRPLGAQKSIAEDAVKLGVT